VRVGDYELGAELGRGGLGSVYRARHVRTGAEVALKRIRFDIDQPRARQRFATECKTQTRLEHPHIVRVHEVGFDGGRPFLALELVRGRSLEGALKAGPLPIGQAVRLTRQVAQALEHAHGQRVLHRDVKPGNVLLDEAGRAKLTDFGLARDLETSLRLTQTGQLSGTPGYQAPEQAVGDVQQQGPATDVYGLGALAYALLTGEAPFERESLIESLRAVVEVEVEPPSSRRPGLDPALDAIVRRCLAKDPAARYDSPGHVDAALAAWERGGAERSRAAPAVAIGLIGLGLLAAGAFALSSPATTPSTAPPPPPAVGEDATPAEPASPQPVDDLPPADDDSPPVVDDPAPVRRPGYPHALFVDEASTQAVLADRDGWVWCYDLPGLGLIESKKLDDATPRQVALAPDATRVAFVDPDGTCNVIGLAEGAMTMFLGAHKDVRACAWSGDSDFLVLAPAGSVVVLDGDVPQERGRAALAEGRRVLALAVARGPDASDRLVVGAVNDQGEALRLEFYLARGQVQGDLVGRQAGAVRVAVNADGSLMASANRQGEVTLYDPGQPSVSTRVADGPVLDMRYTKGDELLVVTADALTVLEPRSGERLRVVPIEPSARLAAVDPLGASLITADEGSGLTRQILTKQPEGR
jgi:hypothetical protein